ncbi:hypothetical protein [Mesorhizobium sp.]|uniref:hypothetical protein n=1 Tax=Mesorhizobium sp. TaxID=1871066 RepID=UPI0025F0C76E|nr:hypothetical protein [Mesorhizobium sp.]
MERVFDDLIDMIRPRPEQRWRGAAAAFALRLAGDLTAGVAIGVGIAVGIALAG